MCRHVRWLCVAILLFAQSQYAASSSISFKNNDDLIPFILSDLYIWLTGAREPITIFSKDDASDDRTIDPGETLTVNINTGNQLDIVRFLPSQKIQIIDGSEYEFSIGVSILDDRIILFSTPDNVPLVPQIGPGYEPPVPPLGTTYSFVNGTNPAFPGLFLGEGVDFTTGDATGAYTGSAQVVSNQLTVTLLAEPSSTILLLSAMAIAAAMGLGAGTRKFSDTRGSWSVVRARVASET